MTGAYLFGRCKLHCISNWLQFPRRFLLIFTFRRVNGLSFISSLTSGHSFRQLFSSRSSPSFHMHCDWMSLIIWRTNGKVTVMMKWITPYLCPLLFPSLSLCVCVCAKGGAKPYRFSALPFNLLGDCAEESLLCPFVNTVVVVLPFPCTHWLSILASEVRIHKPFEGHSINLRKYQVVPLQTIETSTYPWSSWAGYYSAGQALYRPRRRFPMPSSAMEDDMEAQPMGFLAFIGAEQMESKEPSVDDTGTATLSFRSRVSLPSSPSCWHP